VSAIFAWKSTQIKYQDRNGQASAQSEVLPPSLILESPILLAIQGWQNITWSNMVSLTSLNYNLLVNQVTKWTTLLLSCCLWRNEQGNLEKVFDERDYYYRDLFCVDFIIEWNSAAHIVASRSSRIVSASRVGAGHLVTASLELMYISTSRSQSTLILMNKGLTIYEKPSRIKIFII